MHTLVNFSLQLHYIDLPLEAQNVCQTCWVCNVDVLNKIQHVCIMCAAHCKRSIYTIWKDLALLKVRVRSQHILSSTMADYKAISYKYVLSKDC